MWSNRPRKELPQVPPPQLVHLSREDLEGMRQDLYQLRRQLAEERTINQGLRILVRRLVSLLYPQMDPEFWNESSQPSRTPKP